MTARDRLFEMQQLSGMEEGREPSHSESPRNANNSFEEFLKRIDELRHFMMTLNMEREAIRREQEDSLAAGAADTQISRKLNAHVDQFIKQARGLQIRLRDAHNELKNDERSRYGQGRAKKEQIQSLQSAFENVMAKFSEDQIQYKQRAHKKIAEYFRKQNVEVTEEQINDALEAGSLFNLTRNVHLGVQEKKALFDGVKNRATDIMIVEKQIEEVERLFMDMQMMVSQQGDTIDRIETSVVNADEYVARGNKQVRSAVELKKRSMKSKICIFVSLTLLVLLLIIIGMQFIPFL